MKTSEAPEQVHHREVPDAMKPDSVALHIAAGSLMSGASSVSG